MKQFNDYKKCYRCQCIYPIIYYYKNRSTPDSLTTECIECNSELYKSYYRNNRKDIRRQQKRYYKENGEHIRERVNRYRVGNLKKIRKRKYDYDRTEDGKRGTLRRSARQKGYITAEPVFMNIFDEKVEVDYHHINSIFCIPISKSIHISSGVGNAHKECCKDWIYRMYGLNTDVFNKDR